MDIFKLYREKGNPDKAVQMAAYMKNQFPFIGLQSPERKEINSLYFKQLNKNEFTWDFVFDCMSLPEREFTYLATAYMQHFQSTIDPETFRNFERALLTKSWWDSVDSIAPVVGHLCLKYPWLVTDFIEKWIYADNIWLKRTAIIHQLKYKNKTNIDLLSKAILENNKTGEFFIDKAIGWALREYSKTDSLWVTEFVSKQKLTGLSSREALKWIKRL